MTLMTRPRSAPPLTPAYDPNATRIFTVLRTPNVMSMCFKLSHQIWVGNESFVGETLEEAVNKAIAAHPELLTTKRERP